jgi:XTP/dITP diphosphohydrolase
MSNEEKNMGGGFVIATGNPFKAREIEKVIGRRVSLIRPNVQLPAVDETMSSLRGNAFVKAWSAVRTAGFAAMADDTALEIDALNGKPGLYTARFAQAVGSYSAASQVLLEDLRKVPCSVKTARFRTVAVAVLSDGTELSATGILEGSIADKPTGEGGFGFDSIFRPIGKAGRTLAELSGEESLHISHRAVAFRQLADILALRGLAKRADETMGTHD